jgi:hypothetical protein
MELKMVVYIMVNLRPLGKFYIWPFCGHLVYFFPFWYVNQEKSSIPGINLRSTTEQMHLFSTEHLSKTNYFIRKQDAICTSAISAIRPKARRRHDQQQMEGRLVTSTQAKLKS